MSSAWRRSQPSNALRSQPVIRSPAPVSFVSEITTSVARSSPASRPSARHRSIRTRNRRGLLEVDPAQLAVPQHDVGQAEAPRRPCGEAHALDHAAGELEVVEVVALHGHDLRVTQLPHRVGIEPDVRVEGVGEAGGLGSTRSRSGSSGGHADIMADHRGQAFAAAYAARARARLSPRSTIGAG